MLNVLRFLVTNSIGFCTIYFLLVAADGMGLIPHTMPPEMEISFSTWFFGGVMWAWIIGAILSILSFFMKGFFSVFFLLLPILTPLFYGIGVLMFFN